MINNFENEINLFTESKGDVTIAKRMLNILQCGEDKEIEKNSTLNPGSHFSYTHPNLTTAHCDLIFDACIRNKDLIKGSPYTVSFILLQIAAFDFERFVNNYAPLMIKGKEKVQFIFTEIATFVLSPLTGFMLNASKNKNNLPKDRQFDDKKVYDYFSDESADLKTGFGMHLSKFRVMIVDHIKTNIKDMKKEVAYIESPTVYSTSVLYPYQNSMMPTYLDTERLACGFPCRFEVLYLATFFLFQDVYTKEKNYLKTEEKIVQSWEAYYKDVTGFEVLAPEPPVPFYNMKPTDTRLIFRYLKLIPFLCVKSIESIFESHMFLVGHVLGDDPINSAFFMCLSQILILANESFSESVFRPYFEVSMDLLDLSDIQYHIMLHIISRLLDVLCFFPTCLLSDESIVQINTLSLIGFCCMHVEIRKASLKMIKALGRLSPSVSPLYQFIEDNSAEFPNKIWPFFDNNPISLIAHPPNRPKVPLTLKLAIGCGSSSIWQIFLISFGKVAAEKLSPTLISSFKQLAVELLTPSNPDPKNKYNLNYVLQILTLLIALTKADDPSNERIWETTSFFTKMCFESNLYSLLPTIQAIPSESFNYIIGMMNSEEDPFTQILFLRSIAWHPDFFKVADDNLIECFTEAFLKATLKLTDDHLLFYSFTSTLSNQEIKMISDNTVILAVYSSICFKLFTLLKQKHNTMQKECFPCRLNGNDSNHPQLLKLSLLYAPLLNLSLFIPKSKIPFSNRLRPYSIRALSQFLACNKLNNISFLFNDIFTQFESFAIFCPSILQHLLEHNFAEVFPIVLKNSLKPNGLIYIRALSNFFRSSESGVELALDDVLTKQQWANLLPITRSSSRLQVIYENCGTFLFACILYIVRSDSVMKNESFILLATMCPILLLFENGGRRDDTHDFISEIVQICIKNGISFTSAELETISGLGRILCTKFGFCTEQVLKAAFESLPCFPDETINEVLSALMPWFASIDFDFEDRVISKETDLVFICFTCFSFVETLASSFQSPNDFNSPVFGVWRALVMDDDRPTDNFLPVLLCLFYIGERKESLFLLNLIRFLSTLNPPLVMNVVTSQLNFSDFFQQHKNKRNHIFALNCLKLLCSDSIRPAVPNLYLIFAFSVIFKDLYSQSIISLLNCIAVTIEPFVNDDIIDSYTTFRSSINRNDIDSQSIFNFLKVFDDKQSMMYLMELLRWGLCCGDMTLAATALDAQPTIADHTVIGLCARALANVATAATVASEYKPKYINYMKSVLNYLTGIFDSLETPSNAIFWISIECMKCPQKEIFLAALSLFDRYLSNPEIFSIVNGKVKEIDSLKCFTKKMIWEFHSPWNEKFEGCAQYIYQNSECDFLNCVNVLLKLIQIRFTPLISDKPNCLYAAIVALIPWLWMMSAMTINNSIKYINDIKLTIEALTEMLPDFKPLKTLEECFNTHHPTNLKENMIYVLTNCLDQINEEDMSSITTFYTNALKYGPPKMRNPLICCVSKIIHKYPVFRRYLFRFKNYLNSLLNRDGESTDTNINNIDTREFLVLFNDQNDPVDFIVEEGDNTNNINSDNFPVLAIFDRIVVVVVPHLYESNLADQVDIEFDDLNAFPPLLPFDDNIMHLEKFRCLDEHIQQIEIVPFVTWDLMMQKMKFTLTDSGFIPQKLVSKTKQIDVSEIILEEFELVRKDIEKNSPPVEVVGICNEVRGIGGEEEEELKEQANEETFLPASPYELVVVGAWSFVPSVEVANSASDELFEEMGNQDIENM